MALAIVNNIPKTRLANRSEAAEFFGVHLTTIDSWLRRGCPVIQKSGKGSSMVLDLRAMAEWFYKGADNTNTEDPEKLAPKERLDWYKGTRERTKHLEECGELMKAADYETALSAALKALAVGLESFPDQLERDVGLDGAGVAVVQKLVDRLREDLHRRILEP